MLSHSYVPLSLTRSFSHTLYLYIYIYIYISFFFLFLWFRARSRVEYTAFRDQRKTAWELAETIGAERTGTEGNRDKPGGEMVRSSTKRWKRSNSLVKRASPRESSADNEDTTEKHKVNRRHGNGFVIRKAGVPDAWRVSREADETIEARKPGTVVKTRKESLRRATGGGPRRKKKKKKREKKDLLFTFHPLLLLPK